MRQMLTKAQYDMLSPEEQKAYVREMQQQGGHNQEPDEIIEVKTNATHAMGILSDILKGGTLMEPNTIISEAFSIADKFDIEFKKRITAATIKFTKRTEEETKRYSEIKSQMTRDSLLKP